MYITRFLRNDKNKEDYFYHTAEESFSHMMLFKDDDSNLYQSISVIDDDQNTVLAILMFEDGVPMDVFKLGDFVRLRKEHSLPQEQKWVYKIANLNDVTGRADILCTNSDMAIAPIETVGVNMIQPLA